MCDAEGLTREHVPPRCFFPKPYPTNMITVPSCSKHNNDNSKDVEYVRNIIVGSEGINDVGLEMFPPVVRSLERSPKLAQRILSSTEPIIWQGQATGLISTDIHRFRSVMRAVAYAVYYSDFGRTYDHQWGIYHASFRSRAEIESGLDSLHQELQAILHGADVNNKDTNFPEVFKYAFYPAEEPDEHRLIYKFQFYGDFIVYAFGLTKDELCVAESPTSSDNFIDETKC